MTPLNDCAFFLIIIYYEFNYRLSLFVQWPTFCENPFDLLAHSALLYYTDRMDVWYNLTVNKFQYKSFIFTFFDVICSHTFRAARHQPFAGSYADSIQIKIDEESWQSAFITIPLVLPLANKHLQFGDLSTRDADSGSSRHYTRGGSIGRQ